MEDKELISLEAHNAKSAAAYTAEYPRPNGIACPLCGSELLDAERHVLLSCPPRRLIKCSKCAYIGSRIA